MHKYRHEEVRIQTKMEVLDPVILQDSPEGIARRQPESNFKLVAEDSYLVVVLRQELAAATRQLALADCLGQQEAIRHQLLHHLLGDGR